MQRFNYVNNIYIYIHNSITDYYYYFYRNYIIIKLIIDLFIFVIYYITHIY